MVKMMRMMIMKKIMKKTKQIGYKKGKKKVIGYITLKHQ
jgi:hypothetical protein